MASAFRQELDLTNIRKEIDWFYARKGIRPKFIVMSEETQKEIIESVFIIADDDIEDENRKTGYSCVFGIPVATCNILPIGEFEVVG